MLRKDSLHNNWRFFNFSGEMKRNNPAAKIKYVNQHQRSLDIRASRSEHTGKVDYLSYNSGLSAGMAELWGKRTYQEDKFSIDTLVGFEKIPEKDRLKILDDYVSVMQQMLTEKGIKGGSTLNTTILCRNKVYNAHVGDTDSYFGVVDKDGNVVGFIQLNQIHHHPDQKQEEQRLHKQGFSEFVYGDRIVNLETVDPKTAKCKSYACSRAMGNNAMEKFGLSHQPDFFSAEAKIPAGGKAFVITACDGLSKVKEKQICEVLKNHYKEPEYKIAKALCEKVTKLSDNITVAVTALEPNWASAKYQAVFDGFTNSNVSEFLSENSTIALNTCIETYLKHCKEELEKSTSSPRPGV